MFRSPMQSACSPAPTVLRSAEVHEPSAATMASSDEELYEVQKLLDERSVSGKTWSKEYLVSWLGFGSSDDTWECVRPPRPASSSSSRALLRPLLRPLRALLRADRRRVLDRPSRFRMEGKRGRKMKRFHSLHNMRTACIYYKS